MCSYIGVFWDVGYYGLLEEVGADGDFTFVGRRGLLSERTLLAAFMAFSITNRLMLTPRAAAALSMWSFSSSLTQNVTNFLRLFLGRREAWMPGPSRWVCCTRFFITG